MRNVTAPASKSLSHRYCIAAALACGESSLEHVLESRDLQQTRAILMSAGARFEVVGHSGHASAQWLVTGMRRPQGGGNAAHTLSCDVHESGTTCRLLTAVLAAGQGWFRIHGAERMHERPIGELTEALSRLGAEIRHEGRPDCPPLLLHAAGLHPDRVQGDITLGMDASSQYFSGLLLAAPLCPSPLTITLGGSKAVSWPYVGLTLQCLEDFGQRFTVETRPAPDGTWQALPGQAWRELRQATPGCLRITVQPGAYRPGRHVIEGDWSGTSYLLAAGAVGRHPVRVAALLRDSLQGDRAMLDILRRMGARVEADENGVTVYPSALHGVQLDMGDCPDLVPTVAVLAGFAQGSTRIGNVAHLRLKESDRLRAPAEELRKTGVMVDELSDGLLIHGLAGRSFGLKAPVLPDEVALCTHNDHRMAMSLALLSLRDTTINMRERLDNPAVVDKSFPDFWQCWEQIR